MSEFNLDATILDWILALVALEAAIIITLRLFLSRGPRLVAYLSTLLAGTCLLIAVRGVLSGTSSSWIGFWLFLGCVAHFADLFLRWHSEAYSNSHSTADQMIKPAVALQSFMPPISPLPLNPQDEATNG